MVTKIFAALLIVLGISMISLNAQTIIWGGPSDPNSTFDGGLNDWTAVGISCSNNASGQPVGAENATWGWAAGDEVRSMGAYWGNRSALMSPSVSNGAVFFDSDYLDNNGLTTGFGTGTCPSPQVAELISPVIDLSRTQSAAVAFHQYYRRFQGPGGSQNAVATYIHVSVDGGITWIPFIVNPSIQVGAETSNGNKTLVDITSVAAGQSNVQFKFVWDGGYYFWLIDDVQIVTVPGHNNIGLTRHFYGPSSIYTPKAFTDVDTFLFTARVSNFGGNTVDAWFKVSITNPNNTNTFWADSMLVNIPTGTTNRVDSLPTFFVPNELDPAEYRIRYELYQEGEIDFDPSDNVRQSTFVITNNNFWQSGLLRIFNRPCFESSCTELHPWGFGALLKTSENTVERFKLNQVEYQLGGEVDSFDLSGKHSTFFLLEVIDDSFFGADIEFNDNITNEYKAIGDISLAPVNHQKLITVEIKDAHTGSTGYILKKGAIYFPFITVDQGVRIGYDNQFNNFSTGLMDYSVLLKSRLFWGSTFKTTFRDAMPFIRIPFWLVSTNDHDPIPEAAFQLMPNPASSFTQVEIDLKKASNITITLADISGRVLNYENFSNVTQFTHELNVSNIPAGTYLVRVASEYGTKTQKLVVIK